MAVLVAVHGWWGASGSLGSLRHVTPVNFLHTGSNVGRVGPLPAGVTHTATVAGVGTVPANAKAVVLDLSVTGASPATGVWAWPAGSARPAAAWRHLHAGGADANSLVVRVGTGGKIALQARTGTVSLYANVVGYYL